MGSTSEATFTGRCSTISNGWKAIVQNSAWWPWIAKRRNVRLRKARAIWERLLGGTACSTGILACLSSKRTQARMPVLHHAKLVVRLHGGHSLTKSVADQ